MLGITWGLCSQRAAEAALHRGDQGSAAHWLPVRPAPKKTTASCCFVAAPAWSNVSCTALL